MHALLAILAGTVATAPVDFFFFGFLGHSKYLERPEVFQNVTGSHGAAIALASLLRGVTCAGLVLAGSLAEAHDTGRALLVALAMALTVALPLVLTNGIFVRVPRLLLLTHSLGWIAKLAVMAVVTQAIL